MIVSHPARVLFVHVQKTGGSTVQSVLLDRLPGAEKLAGLPGAKHAHLGAALKAQPELAAYWTFGFVRNPWARLWSWWSMIDRRQGQRDEGHAWATRRIDNNTFWSGVLAGPAGLRGVRADGSGAVRPAADTAAALPRRRGAAGRLHRADRDVRRRPGAGLRAARARASAAGAAPQRPTGGGRSGGSYRDHYTAAMRERVAELFEPDLREFGYEF